MKSKLEWIYFFFVLCSVSGAIGRIFGGQFAPQAGGTNTTALSSGDSDPILFLFSLAIAGATLVLCFSKLPSVLALLKSLRWLTGLYALVAVSILWSADRVSTFRGAAYLLIYLAAAIYIAMRFSSEEILIGLRKTVVLLALLSIIGQFLLPPSGDPAPGWTGVFPQKNDLGIVMAVGFAVLLVQRARWNLARVALLALCATLLILSQSFTSILAALAVVAAVTYLHCSGALKLLVLMTVAGTGLLIVFAASDVAGTLEFTGKDMTLTGRTLIWSLVAESMKEHAVLGYGYNAFWTSQADVINQFSTWHPGQAHNGYLDICLNLGAIGLCLTVGLIFDSWRRGRRLRLQGRNAGVWMLAALWLLLVRSCAESTFLNLSFIWFVVLMSYLSCWKEEFGATHDFLVALAHYNAEAYLPRPASGVTF